MPNQIEQPVKNIPERDMLFGDLPLSFWGAVPSNEIPWTLFRKVKELDEEGEDLSAIETLREIIALPGLESRQYLQAFYFLRRLYAVAETDKKLYGVVVEVAMEEGTDLLAVYADHSARYYNYTGSGVVWETGNVVIEEKIDNILSLGKDIVRQIGPWTGERPGVPRPGFARINFLTPAGLHFGEAEQTALFRDPLAGEIMHAMLDMMQTLTSMAGEKK